MAGTEDQYLALAVSTAYSTKANVIGPVSNYLEYLQVPRINDTELDDTGNGGSAYKYSGRTPRLIVEGTLKQEKFVPTKGTISVKEKERVYVYGIGPDPINIYHKLENEWEEKKEAKKVEIKTTVTEAAECEFSQESALAPAAGTKVWAYIGEEPVVNATELDFGSLVYSLF